MTRINTNVASIRGLNNLQKSNNLLGTSLTRLSTGVKINSGKDNPSGLIASETLRTQITTIEKSISNSNRANNVIATADGALGEISGLLNQIRGLVQEGLNDGALSDDEKKANQLQIDAALSAINRISSNTTFAGDKLIDGSKSFTTQMETADAAELSDFQINEALFGSSNTIEIAASITSAATQGELTYAGGPPSSGLTLEVGGSRGNEVLFFGANSSLDDIEASINSLTDATGVEAEITTATALATVDIAAGTETLTFTERSVNGDNVSIVFEDPSANDSPLGVTVTGVGTGNATITVSLETDGSGNLISDTQDIIDAIEGDDDANALVTVETDGAGTQTAAAVASTALAGRELGEMVLRSVGYGSKEFVDVNVLAGSFSTTNSAGTTVGRSTGADVVATINGQLAQGDGLKASIRTGSLDASVSFNTANNALGTTSTITVTGGGSVFQIGEQVSVAGQVGIGIEAVNTARLGGVAGKLYELGSGGGKSLLDVGPDVRGQDLVDIIDQSLNRVNSLRGRLGAFQQNVIETNISTLGVALENLSEARSQIVDTDFATETANMTRAQILSQSGISVLSIANQNPQQVLSLLG